METMEVNALKVYIDTIKEQIISMGVQSGDILYVSSDMTGILKEAQDNLGFKDKSGREQFLNALIDMLKDIVGLKGTLLFPMYNWDFCKGTKFSIRTTKSKVGALNNFILENRSDFKRTRHPLYSFMVTGKDADYLCSLDNQEAFGPNSPFAYLDNRNAKHLAMGIGMADGLTFVHYLEQLANVPYRYHKIFLGEYEDENGITEIRAYSQFVRRLEIEFEFALTDKFLFDNKILKQISIYDQKFSLLKFSEVKPILYADLKNGAKAVYNIKNYEMLANLTSESPIYEVGKLSGYEHI